MPEHVRSLTASGKLDVGDGHAIHWEVAGTGKPAVVLHGGPGQGSSPNMLRGFDLTRYRVVLFDQRGCGRSTPHASDPASSMEHNTTWHLVADMERLREHLRIERWLVVGGSWGTTLALAYAEKHPSRVSEMVLLAITTSRRAEADWLYGGLARFFPEAHERFRAQVPEATTTHEIIAAYARRMEDADAAVRLAAARAWCAWEDAALGLEPHPQPDVYADKPESELVAFVRICTHFLAHDAWLEDGALLRDAGRLSKIPGVLIHGRRDMTCPIGTAHALARAWPAATLVDLPDSGHLRSDEKRAAVVAAYERFAPAG
ncbi:MAG TPA: prolyl aminopeptidase [Polyangiaceae bacterium]|jgi:proline iminopeptidase